MRKTMTAAAATLLLFSPLAAHAGDVPQLNVAPMCHGIADQGADPMEAGDSKVSFKQCLDSESADKATLQKEWSTFSAVDQQQCTAAVTMGGLPSYTDLLTCLEMARDVEKDRAQQKAPSKSIKSLRGPIIINLCASERVLDLRKSIVSHTHTSSHLGMFA